MNKRSSHSILQLWLMLASIPMIILLLVYVLGTFAFDDDAIIEVDPSQSKDESNRIPDIEISDMDKEFSAPVDLPTSEKTLISNQQQSVLADIKSFSKEQSLTQMLSKKNENLLLDSNGHPLIIRVQENDNLKVLANRHFGDSAFWTYIYIVNKEKINTPDAVKAGMTLNLPDSTYYDINSRDSLSIKKAESLGNAIK